MMCFRMIKMGVAAFMVFSHFYATAQDNKWEAPKDADTLKNPIQVNEGVIEQGRELYIKYCAICHGDKGKGDGVGGMALTPHPADLTSEKVQSQSDGALFWKLTKGNPPMAGYEKILNETERWQLVNYIRTLSKDKK